MVEIDRPCQLPKASGVTRKENHVWLAFIGLTTQVYEACQLGKQHRLPFPNERNQSCNKLDLIHSDVWGLTQNVILGESPCFISFIDNYSRHSYFYLGEKKSDDFMKRITCGSVYDRRESV